MKISRAAIASIVTLIGVIAGTLWVFAQVEGEIHIPAWTPKDRYGW